MARHQCMPPKEAGYTYAVEPTAINRLLANEEESIYRPSNFIAGRLLWHKPVIEPAIEATGYQHAWWLRFDWIARREEALLGVSAGISQISDDQGLDGGESFYPLFGGMMWVFIFPTLRS